MFALPPEAVPIVLNVDTPDRALTASFQAAGASVEALYFALSTPLAADPHYCQSLRQAISFTVKAVLIAAGRTPDPYRGAAYSEGQVFLTPAPGPRLYLRDHSDGRLERFALLATDPARAGAPGARVATVRDGFSAVPLEGDSTDDGPGDGLAVDLPGPRPAAAAAAALADPRPVTALAVPWPTTRQPYAVAQPPFRGRGRPRGRRLPAPAPAPRRSSPRGAPAPIDPGPGAGPIPHVARAGSPPAAARRRGRPPTRARP